LNPDRTDFMGAALAEAEAAAVRGEVPIGAVLVSAGEIVDEKGGAVVSGVRFFASPTCHHAPEVYSGFGEVRASEMLKRFFRERRPA